MNAYRIGFIGFGHMVQVIFEALDRAKIVPRSHVSFIQRDTAKMKRNEQEYGITSTSLENLVRESDLIFLGFRPQQAELALGQLAQVGGLEGKWVVSILAGTKIAQIQKKLGSGVQILRTMPNIASAVGEGMTILCYAPSCSAEFKEFGTRIFSSMGEVAELGENHMDTVVGMSGSGPGFIFRLIDVMARTGEKHGIPYAKGLKIAAQTFAGAARLILKGDLPSDLLSQITTPNGTTQAGLEMMTKTEIDKHFQAVIEASSRRSAELSK
jgi:pyrroline-5-carboxylate reductase